MCLSLFLTFSLCADDSCAHVSLAAHGGLGSGGFSMITSLKDTPGPHHYIFSCGGIRLALMFGMHQGKGENCNVVISPSQKKWNRHDVQINHQCVAACKCVYVYSLVLQSPDHLEKMRSESSLPSSRMNLQSCHPILTLLKRNFPLKRARLSRFDLHLILWFSHIH